MVTRRNFTKLEVKVVKLSLQDQFALECRCRQIGQNLLFCPIKFDRGQKTEKSRICFQAH